MPKTVKPGSSTEPASDRRVELLETAARRFVRDGFQGTSMRDIAGDVGMLAGSLYHHFRSKDELIAAVYGLGVEQIIEAVDRALENGGEPWEQLESACAAHLETLVESPFAAVLTADVSHLAPEPRRRLVKLRDRYEKRFVELVNQLELPPDVDRRLLRLHLLGALNWTPTWYRRDGESPTEIARAYVTALRRG